MFEKLRAWLRKLLKIRPKPPPALLTKREQAKTVVQNMPVGKTDDERRDRAIVFDYACGMERHVIAARHHCSTSTVDRRVREAIARWLPVTQ